MRLEIRKSGKTAWSTLSAVRDNRSTDKSFEFLRGQQNDWVQNGGPEYVSAEYRIGSYDYKSGKEVWEDYKPKTVLA